MVTEALKLEPHESFAAGAEFDRGGQTIKRRHSVWRLNSGLNDTEPLWDHVDALLHLLEGHRATLAEVRLSFKIRLVCVAFCYQAFNFEIEFERQRRATDLGLTFWFDI